VPLAVTLEADLHASTEGLGPSICSVGLPEELAKAIPVLAVALIYHRGRRQELIPRDYLFLGAVSGLAFGPARWCITSRQWPGGVLRDRAVGCCLDPAVDAYRRLWIVVTVISSLLFLG
jgi:hypothetical protein